MTPPAIRVAVLLQEPGVDASALVDAVRRIISCDLAPVVVGATDALATAQARLTGAGLAEPVTFVTGAGRLECVAALDDTAQAVLLHDPARPLASTELWRTITDLARSGVDAAFPTTVMVDSVKAVDDSGTVLQTVDRENLRSVEYPRAMSVRVLREMLASASADELTYCLATGVDVVYVAVERSAFETHLPSNRSASA